MPLACSASSPSKRCNARAARAAHNGDSVDTLETLTSPDGMFQLEIINLGHELGLFFEVTDAHKAQDPNAEGDWHTHAEFWTEEPGMPKDERECLRRIAAYLVLGTWALQCDEYEDGRRVWDVSNEPTEDIAISELMPDITSTTFRTWDGEVVDPTASSSA